MRLTCVVRVVCHEPKSGTIPHQGGRGTNSTIALVIKPKECDRVFLIHFSSVNKYGKRYKINENIEKVFTKFCGEGKATIKFKEPTHEMYIQADPVQLKVFLKTLHMCVLGKIEESGLSRLSGMDVMAKTPTPTKLTIDRVSDIPLRGLPRTVQNLTMSDLGMSIFKREILSLRSLKILDLSKNKIEKLPPELGKMPFLVELIVKHNKIGTKPDWRWTKGEQIRQNLRLLDLSHNELSSSVPIFKFKKLVTLKLDGNKMTFIPVSIGTMTSLRYFSMSDNKVKTLPASLLKLRLEAGDFSSNDFWKRQNVPLMALNKFSFKAPTLVELASTVVLKYNLFYSRNTIPYTLVDYLDDCDYCLCGRPNFDNSNYTEFPVSLQKFCRVVTNDLNNTVIFNCYLHSECYRDIKRYQVM